MKKNNKTTYLKPLLHVAIISTPTILAGSTTGTIESGGTDGKGEHSLPADAKELPWSFDIEE